MADSNEKPLTLSELVKYYQETLFPFMKENFVTKKEFESFVDIVATKDELKQGLDGLGGRIDGVAKDVKEIKSLLVDFGGRTKDLEKEVGYIKNTFSIPALKKI